MSTDSQFWWNWWVNFWVATATFMAVLVALFGEWIRAHFFPQIFLPKLKLELRSSLGDKTPVELFDPIARHAKQGEGRYYHAYVSNENHWSMATQVQVYLLSIEEPTPSGRLAVTWTGAIPIQWRHQAIYPLARTIGPVAECDLCSVVKDNWVELHPLAPLFNLKTQRNAPVNMVISLQVRANEVQSPIAKFSIIWNGKWDDGDFNMAQHMVVKKITSDI